MTERAAADYDVVIIGGAIAGASAALLLRRSLSGCRVLIIERKPRFDRKVGEATVEVSGFFLHRVLGLYDHLAREHLPKHGLRYWFSDQHQRTLEQMSEIGSIDLPRLPSFQLDRARLDEYLLALALSEGCELARPAKCIEVDLHTPLNTLCYRDDQGHEHRISARWIIDASGRQAFIARRHELLQTVPQHPTAAAWARWHNVADLDGIEILGNNPAAPRLPPVNASRRLATNHFCGYGWWCWVIPLADRQTSIGLVYNKELLKLDQNLKPHQRYRQFVLNQPGLRELLAGASMVEDDFFALATVPYKSRRYMGDGWALIGDAASFIDPYYSPGLDHMAISTYATVQLLKAQLGGELRDGELEQRITNHNDQFDRSYDRWLGGIYENKYELMGDAEVLRCAFLIDTCMYFLGMVKPVHDNPANLANPPFGQPIIQARIAYRIMRFFNRRFTRLARFRRLTGRATIRNSGWHRYSSAFGLGWSLVRPFAAGLRQWLKLEAEYSWYRLRGGKLQSSEPVATSKLGSSIGNR